MSGWTTYRAYRRRRRTQWLEPDALRDLQEAALRDLVRHAAVTVPYYRRLFEEAGIPPREIVSLTDLKGVPVTTKADLQALEPHEVTSSAFAPESLMSERTSGSSGRPFEMRFDRRFVAFRNALFLRALAATGYRALRPALLVTGHRPPRPRRWLRWNHVSMEDPPERLAAALDEHEPWLLYGPVTTLRQLALHMRGTQGRHHRPRVVVSTAEALDEATRRLLGDVLAADIFDFYGLTETGMLGWECAEHDGMHLSEDSVVVELEPTGDGDECRLVVTNLELRSMPIIRYATGDLVRPGPTGRCACGRHLARLASVSGRVVDCVHRADGATLSPYRLTLALEEIDGLRRYQVVQEELDRFTFRFESEHDAAPSIEAAAREALRRVLGPDAVVAMRRDDRLEPPPGRKFRVVECRLHEERRS